MYVSLALPKLVPPQIILFKVSEGGAKRRRLAIQFFGLVAFTFYFKGKETEFSSCLLIPPECPQSQAEARSPEPIGVSCMDDVVSVPEPLLATTLVESWDPDEAP